MKAMQTKGWWLRSWRGWIGMASMAPLAVAQSGDYTDSSATRFNIAGGAGTYAVVNRGCNGEVLSKYKRDFRDAGAGVQHEFDGPLVLGVRSQWVSVSNPPGDDLDQVLWNPHAALEWRNFGFGAGYVTPNGDLDDSGGPYDFEVVPVSAHLRFGDPRRFDVSFRMMEGEPYYSSGGSFAARVGARVSPAVRAWLGIGSTQPFDAAGFIAGGNVRIARGLEMNVGGRLGGSEGISENSIRAGLSYTWTHRRYDYRPSAPPAADSGASATLMLELEDGTVLSAVSIQPWSMGSVKVILASGEETFVSEAKVRSIRSAEGDDLTKKVLEDRRRVP